MPLLGYYQFSNGSRGWCRPAINGQATSIDFEDGSYTCVSNDNPFLTGAKELSR